ncbi:MAG: hypothetical protein HZA50_11445 [Planctomycetes bacterium]|nr:hypothetical protein [Planctomycetota bacterium]
MTGNGQIAGAAACGVFLLLALVGWISGQSAWVCAWRALAGAAGLYVLIRVVSWIVWKIVVDVVARNQAAQSKLRNGGNDNRS